MIIPSILDWDNAGLPLGKLHEHGFREVKMGARRVAPTTGVGGLVPVGRAEVGGSDGYRG